MTKRNEWPCPHCGATDGWRGFAGILFAGGPKTGIWIWAYTILPDPRHLGYESSRNHRISVCRACGEAVS